MAAPGAAPIFVLTHHPEDAQPYANFTFLNCDIAEAVETGLAAAGGKNIEVFGSNVARQCVERGLIDEFYVHIAPVMLGDSMACAGSPSWRRSQRTGLLPGRFEQPDAKHAAVQAHRLTARTNTARSPRPTVARP